MFERIQSILNFIRTLNEESFSWLNVLLPLIVLLFSLGIAFGEYGIKLSAKFETLDHDIAEIKEEYKKIDSLIDKRTKNRYTSEQADIQIKAYDDTIENLQSRINNLETHCFKK